MKLSPLFVSSLWRSRASRARQQGQLKLSSEDLKAFESIVDKLPRRWRILGYRKELVRGRPAPFNVAPAAAIFT